MSTVMCCPVRSRDIKSASAVSVWRTNRREIAERLVDFASLSTGVPTGSAARACRRVATPASIRSITTCVSTSSAAKRV
jgi:hypothetical protein